MHAFRSTDLTPEDRIALERLVGRQLQNDEAVQVTVLKVQELQPVEWTRRKEAAARILELAKGKRLGDATVRELIDEGRRF